MATLVTGATGTVGAAVVDALLAAGREVRALVRDPARARTLLPAAVDLATGDVTDRASLDRAVQGCDAVFHTAGLPEQWLRDPRRFTEVNVDGTRHVGEAALAAKVASFVYTSTIDVFAWQAGQPFDETTLATTPKHSYYERSKQEADRAMVALQARGLPVRYVHPSAVYGPVPVINPGLNDVLVRLIRGKIPAMLPGGIPVVLAADVATGQLLAERAPVGGRFIFSESHVSLIDLARAVIAAAGTGKLPRVLPVWLAKLVSATGEGLARITRRPPLIPAGQLQFLLENVHPSAARAIRELGWKPTPLAGGLTATIASFRTRGQI